MYHILEAQQFSRETMENLFQVATMLESRIPSETFKGIIMASLFYEPSTRTRFSFESAMIRHGGDVIGTEQAHVFSSAAKGESLEDTIRVVSNYADVIVLRHDDAGAAARAADVSLVPIINAGDGVGQHPTQGLLDVYTILRELRKVDDLAITFMGDLKHGRTVRSLAYLLAKFETITMHFVSPPELRIGDDIKAYLDRQGLTYYETEAIDCVFESDVVYQTRVQKERFQDYHEYERVKDIFQITRDVVDHMLDHAILMHPLPRVDEIAPEVDTSCKATYFRQASYGVSLRAALLTAVLLDSGKIKSL